ncbi:MAG: hypothetical protein HYY13_02630 [Nitrospirae bacterium]|nr:hypothetical protein [Nitrospirota bacterium]
MAFVDRLNREVVAKVVYWGAAGSGKSENLRAIMGASPEATFPLNLPEPDGRWVECIVLRLGELSGYQVSVQLCAPRDLPDPEQGRDLLKGADSVVFVVDSAPAREAENLRALESLRQGVGGNGSGALGPHLVVQYNKRDLEDACPMEVLRAAIPVVPEREVEAAAARGEGTMETLKEALRIALVQLRAELTVGVG